MAKRSESVIGRDVSLLSWAAQRNRRMNSVDVATRLRAALAYQPYTRPRPVDNPLPDHTPSLDRLIVAATTAHLGRYYYVELWRSTEGMIVTIAREIQRGMPGRIVNDVRTLHVLRDNVLHDEIADAVAEAMDARRIDPHACWQLCEELTGAVDEMVRSGDRNNLTEAAKDTLDQLLQMPERWVRESDGNVVRR